MATTMEWTGLTDREAGAKTDAVEFSDALMCSEMAVALAWQQSLIDAVQQSIITTDLDGVVTSWNRFATTMFGWTAEQAIGRDVREFLYHADEAPIATHAIRSVGAGSTLAREREVRCRDGRRKWIAVTAAPIRDMTGAITHIVATSSDITERRRLESEFHQAQKMEAVGRLAAGVAHDFNNLLTVIRANAEFILSADPRGDADHSDIDEIIRAVDRASALTRQLLTFSRQQVLKPRAILPNEIVSNLEKMFVRLIGEDIEMRIDLRPDTPAVIADPGQLEQALANLIVNARDAMPTGGALRVATYPFYLTSDRAAALEGTAPGAYAAISVTDSGVGMSPEIRARLFEPFFTTKEVGRGTGLGLATVYGMVRQLGGFIDVQTVERNGSTFTLCLPATSVKPTGSKDTVHRAPESGQETILVVEDQPEVRTIASRVLSSHGYRVIEASNGIEAMTFLIGDAPGVDIVLSDAVMPRMGGVRLLEAIRSRHLHLPVLLMSGYAEQESLAHGLLDQGVEYIGKPFRSEELLRGVRSMLDTRAGLSARSSIP